MVPHRGSDPPLTLCISPEEDGLRLEQVLIRRFPALGRGEVRRAIQGGLVQLDGAGPVRKGSRLTTGQRLLVDRDLTLVGPAPQPELPLHVLAVEPGFVVVNKLPGLPSHPLVPGERNTLANALAARFPECATASPTAREGGLVHRLDRSTSGVLLAARDPRAYALLRRFFVEKQVRKDYLALVEGRLAGEAVADCALEPVPGDPARVRPATGLGRRGQEALTQVIPVEDLGTHTLVRALCTSGRRHQVRAHLAFLGHPLVDDALYGGSPLPGCDGAFLHASRLTLPGTLGDYQAPMPSSRAALLARLRAKSA